MVYFPCLACRGKPVAFLWVAETHHKTVPSFSSFTPEVGRLVVESVAINSGYTSKVLVSPQHLKTFLNFLLSDSNLGRTGCCREKDI